MNPEAIMLNETSVTGQILHDVTYMKDLVVTTLSSTEQKGGPPGLTGWGVDWKACGSESIKFQACKMSEY